MNWLEYSRTLMRKKQWYTDFRRWQREGFLRAYFRRQLWRKILSSSPIRTASSGTYPVEVHLLCHRLDYLPAIWSLKSFYKAAKVDFPLVIHINGAASQNLYRRLAEHFPNAKLVPQAVADKQVEDHLKGCGWNRLLKARRASPFMMKLTDFSLIANAFIVLAIDSDVLFFLPPKELINWCNRPTKGYLFQTDPTTNYNITFKEAADTFGIQLKPQINTGIMAYCKDTPDFASFNEYLCDPGVNTSNGFIEQTLYAIHASHIGFELLPESKYVISLKAGSPYAGIVARHYAGPSRNLMTSEGIPFLQNNNIIK